VEHSAIPVTTGATKRPALPRRPSSAGITKNNPKNKINGTILIGDQLDLLSFLQSSKTPSQHQQHHRSDKSGFLKTSVYNPDFIDFTGVPSARFSKRT
jgi:hypothetical protein